MKNRRFPLLFASFLAAAGPTHAASLILASQGGWNGFAIEADIKAGFRQAGGTPGIAKEVSSGDGGFLLIAPDIHPPGTTLNLTSTTTGSSPLSSSITPDTGMGKDIASGTLGVTFTIGTATTDDSFSFLIDSTTSAETAMVDFGAGLEPVDSFFEVSLKLSSFAPATIPGALIQLPALPTLTAPTPSVESMNSLISSYLGGAPVVGFQSPGDPGLSFPLELNGLESFEYELIYSIVTPFGSDPTVSYAIQGGSSVPEPETLPLAGLAILILRRRKRSCR